MDERKLQVKKVRSRTNQVSATMLIYYLIMTITSVVALLLDAAFYAIGAYMNGAGDMMDVIAHISESAMSNGWGYLVAIAIGCLIMYLWKGKDFCFRAVFAREKKMTLGAFVALLCIFIAPQALLQVYVPAFEWLLNQMGFSATQALEVATIQTDAVSMFLYVSILGPISEELLCRGLVLRVMRPHGKQAAIFVSAALFGLYHGNAIQIPFAFLVGLVLGYVTVEYSIIWAMILHIINNFVLSDLAGRLSEVYPLGTEILFWSILGGSALATVVLLIVRRKDVVAYFRENKMTAVNWRGVLSSPVLWVFVGIMLLMSLLTITRI